jgi:hypothetical protein
MPSVLSSSLKRTRSIYAFLDTRHETQQTNHIVETSPQVLSYSLERTRSIYAFLDARHETQQTNHIVETLPPVLGYSLERTRSIYEFLDTRHETQQTNHIVETLPSVLSYSLERTRSIYRNLEKKVNNANEYIASFPLILYLSPETVESSSLNQLLNIVRKLEERVQKREIPLIGEFGDRTDRVMYQEFINAE